MSQYPRLFGTTRVPQVEKDELRTTDDSKHIVVFCQGYAYALDIIGENGVPLPEAALARSLAEIEKDAKVCSLSIQINFEFNLF